VRNGGSWTARRALLNHSVLHNQFILSLRAVEGKLAAGALGHARERELLDDTLPRWVPIRADVDTLMDTFERAMSPEALFERGPLNGVPASVRSWLLPLTVGLWRARSGSPQLIRTTTECLEAVDAAQCALREKWSNLENGERSALISRLIDRCQSLSDTLSRFPTVRGL
jgi:hypothetical protein